MNHTDRDRNVRNISNICLTPYMGKVYLATAHLLILIFLDSIIFLCNLVANTLVIVIIVKTKQLSNIAFKLIFNLSLAGIGQTVLGQTFFLINLITGISCLMQYTGQFIILFFGYTTVYTIGGIGFDRYLRVKYKTSFATILTRKRFHILIFVIYCFALARSSITLTGFLSGKFKFIRILGAGVDYLSMFLIAFMQMASVIVIKRIVASSDNQEVMRETSKGIIKLSSRITIVYLIFSITSVTMLVLHNMLRNTVAGTRRQIIEFVQMLAFLIAHANSFASAVLFFMYNSKAKSFFRSILRSFFPVVYTNSQQKKGFSLSVMPRTLDDAKSNWLSK